MRVAGKAEAQAVDKEVVQKDERKRCGPMTTKRCRLMPRRKRCIPLAGEPFSICQVVSINRGKNEPKSFAKAQASDCRLLDRSRIDLPRKDSGIGRICVCSIQCCSYALQENEDLPERVLLLYWLQQRRALGWRTRLKWLLERLVMKCTCGRAHSPTN